MVKGVRIDVEKAILLAETRRGNLSRMAKDLGCSREGLSKVVAREPRLAAALEAARECMVDSAEDGLGEAVDKREPWAIKTALFGSRHGRARGYGESISLEQTGKLVVEIRYPDEDADDND